MYPIFVALDIVDAIVTCHKFRLFFLLRTMIIRVYGFSIPMYRLSPIDFEVVFEHSNGSSYLVG